jgi:CheY-like chemotaxis protein
MSKKHIFYLEDEETVLDHWSQILSLENYRVTKASDAQDAMNEIDRFIAKREVVDYFLLDIMIIPWKPFSKKETLYGYLTGFKVADYILSKGGWTVSAPWCMILAKNSLLRRCRGKTLDIRS